VLAYEGHQGTEKSRHGAGRLSQRERPCYYDFPAAWHNREPVSATWGATDSSLARLIVAEDDAVPLGGDGARGLCPSPPLEGIGRVIADLERQVGTRRRRRQRSKEATMQNPAFAKTLIIVGILIVLVSGLADLLGLGRHLTNAFARRNRL
jgi:hypothetical protein